MSDSWRGYSEADWDRKSLAVIACDGDGGVAVLWTVGPHIEYLRDELGVILPDDLGIGVTPPGLWVCEGVVIGVRHPATLNRLEECDLVFYGVKRPLTEDEWAAVKNYENPWVVEKWLNGEYS